MFSFEKWNSQLQLIKGCYSGQENVISELLKVGAPAEINPLFIFKTVGIPHRPRLSSWPLRAVLEARALGRLRSRRGRLFCDVGHCSNNRNIIVRYPCIILSFFFVFCKCDPWNTFSAKSPDGRSIWRHTTRDGELRQIGNKYHWDLSDMLFWRCRLLIENLSRRILAGQGSPIRSPFSEGTKSIAALCS